MDRQLILTLSAAAVLVGTAAAGGQPEAQANADMPHAGQTLVVSAWGFNMDLIEKNVVQPFEDKHGADVVFETGNNSERFTRMAARKNNPEVDVALFAANWALKAADEGLLQPYSPAALTNLDDVYEIVRDPLGNQTAVGYSVQNLGIVYRTDMVEPISSWRDLARPELSGFLSIPNITTTYGPALIYMLGAAFGNGYDDHEAGWKALEQMADSITTAYSRSSELTTLVAQEEVYAAPYSSFSWGSLAAAGHPVAKAVPQEGLPGAFATISISRGADNVDLAHLYIDHMLSYEVQRAQAMDMVDSPVRPDIELPQEIGENLTYGRELINQLHFFDLAEISAVQAEWIDRWNAIFTD